MSSRWTLAEIIGTGVAVEPHEAVAIVQELINGSLPRQLEPPFGPPSLESVELGGDGTVLCRHCGATPATSEIGRLLDSLLPKSRGGVAGGLRYAVARALNEVDAPPFDSVHDLSSALERFERGPRRDALTALARRLPPRPFAAPQKQPVVEPFDDPLVLRYPPSAKERPPILAARRSNLAAWLALAAVAASVSFSATYVMVLHRRIRAETLSAARTGPAHTPEVARVDRQSDLATTRGRVAVATAGARETAATALEWTAKSPEPGIADADVVPAAGPDDGPMFSPSFASNGTAIFYHTGRSGDARSALAVRTLDDDLHVLTILDGDARNYHVQPSPDGTRIAFDSDRDGERGVYVANSDGSNVHRISGPGYAAVPTWSPDGQRLAFVRAEAGRSRVWNLWLTTLATDQSRRLTNFGFGQTWGASWFPDGRHVAYSHEDQLFVLDLDAGSTRVFTSPVAGRLVRTPAVSPDGERIVFQVARNGAWLLHVADGSMRCILTDPTAEEFAWSPDGRRVAFHSRRDGRWGIWIAAPEQS